MLINDPNVGILCPQSSTPMHPLHSQRIEWLNRAYGGGSAMTEQPRGSAANQKPLAWSWENGDFRTVIVQPGNDGNPHSAPLFQRPQCPHGPCLRFMVMHQPPFLTDEPPSWMCPVHGNEGMAFIYDHDSLKPKDCGATSPYIGVYAVLVFGGRR